MDPLQIVLIVVALAGVWALVEVALLARKGRDAVQKLDTTVNEVNDTLAEARPVIAKLDGTIDELQPAIQRVEPLLASANVAVDALSANLVEVEAVVRDVSSFTGTAVNAKHAARGMADSASGAVQRLFGKRKQAELDPDRALADAAEAPAGTEAAAADAPAPAEEGTPEQHYYTYDADEAPAAKEGSDA